MVEPDLVTTLVLIHPDGFQELDGSHGDRVDRVHRHIERHADVRLGTEVVHLVGLDAGQKVLQVASVSQISVVEVELLSLVVGVLVHVVNTTRVEARSPADQAVDLISFAQQKFGKVRTILAGDTCDECNAVAHWRVFLGEQGGYVASPIDQIRSRLGNEVLRISFVSKDRFLGFGENQAHWHADTETMPFDLKNKRVVVTGGAGFMGRFVCDKVAQRGAAEVVVPRRAEFDLTTESAVERLYATAKPDVVIHLAAEVGGIGANRDNPGRYFYANMAMALHLIEHARRVGLPKFVQVGTICAYPKHTPVPFKESDLWDGYPEETNAPYGVAKKAAMVMLDAYQRQYGLSGAYLLPVNLYGPWDNFDLHTSHVIPALIRKCVEARDSGQDHIECWGTGSASREFLYVEDAAEGVVRATEVLDEPVPVNLGTNMEITIKDLVELIVKLTNFQGEIRWDSTKPDGQPRRCLDVSRAAERLDWQAQVGFEDGLRRTIAWYEEHRDAVVSGGGRA